MAGRRIAAAVLVLARSLLFHAQPATVDRHRTTRDSAAPLSSVNAGIDRPSPGYEPYDARLWRLGLSRAAVVTSADRTDSISLGRLRLLSRRVAPRLVCKSVTGVNPLDLRFPAFPRVLVSVIAWRRSCHVEHDQYPAAADLELRSLPKKPAADVSDAGPPRTYG